MRVAPDHLGIYSLDHVAERKAAGLPRQRAVQYHLQQHIPEFFPEIIPVFPADGAAHFARLFPEMLKQGGMCLPAVPRTAPGSQQRIYYLFKGTKA